VLAVMPFLSGTTQKTHPFIVNFFDLIAIYAPRFCDGAAWLFFLASCCFIELFFEDSGFGRALPTLILNRLRHCACSLHPTVNA